MKKLRYVLPVVMSLIIVFATVVVGVGSAYAWDELVCLASDFGDAFWTDAQGFANTIDTYPGWNNFQTSHDPQATWWKEESSGGIDNQKADYTELSLIQAHGPAVNVIGSGPDAGQAPPSTVRLGYTSPDNFGYSIWSFIIECERFKDAWYQSYFQCLTGTHMLLGFKSTATILSTDLRELANRLTGTGGYAKQLVKWAYFDTYVCADGDHNNNQARIIAENDSVASNDYIDSFDTQTPVDSTKVVYTCYLGG